MTIALYASQLAPTGPTGIHRYVTEIARTLLAIVPERYTMVASAEDAPPVWFPSDLPVTRLPGPRRALHLAWYLARRPRIERFIGDTDLVHVLSPTFPVPSRAPIVYTIHDLQHIDDAGAFRTREARIGAAALRDAARRARRIITVSGAVAERTVERLGVDRGRITVVHHGIAERFHRGVSEDLVRAVTTRYGLEPRDYFLYVGKVEDRKNVGTVVRALAERGPGPRLVVTGPAGFGVENVTAAIERLGLTGEVILTGHVPDGDLLPMMAGATALVHPSEFEGFGFTPLEAMALGTPTIASRAGSLPEVLGDAALLLAPRDVTAWANAMSRLERDAAYATELAEKGRRHASRFTWERAARETAAVHDAAMSG